MEKRTVLIVDDAPDVRKILRFHLENKYTVLEAPDGLKGLEMIRLHHPSLVILDVNMPKMGGVEVYAKISAGTGKPVCPVIVLTIREEMGMLFKNLDVDGFITKPFDINYVLKEVDLVIDKRYGAAEVKKASVSHGPKKVLLIDDNPNAFSKIVVAFLNAGFLISSAQSGVEAFEKIITDTPDLIVIKLGLSDLSGDIVCLKLKQMPRTMGIPVVLYTPFQDSLDRAVVANICRVSGTELVESNEPSVLLAQARRLLETPK